MVDGIYMTRTFGRALVCTYLWKSSSSSMTDSGFFAGRLFVPAGGIGVTYFWDSGLISRMCCPSCHIFSVLPHPLTTHDNTYHSRRCSRWHVLLPSFVIVLIFVVCLECKDMSKSLQDSIEVSSGSSMVRLRRGDTRWAICWPAWPKTIGARRPESFSTIVIPAEFECKKLSFRRVWSRVWKVMSSFYKRSAKVRNGLSQYFLSSGAVVPIKAELRTQTCDVPQLYFGFDHREVIRYRKGGWRLCG